MEVITPVLELPTTSGVTEMINNNHVATELGDGVLVQNGLTTTQTHTKAATGEEVLQNPVMTTRRQYGLPESAVIFCNFNQLYKIDPVTLDIWCNILTRVPNAVLWLLRFPAVGETHVINHCKQVGFFDKCTLPRLLFDHRPGKLKSYSTIDHGHKK